MKSRAPCAVFSASMGSFLGWVPSERDKPSGAGGRSPASPASGLVAPLKQRRPRTWRRRQQQRPPPPWSRRGAQAEEPRGRASPRSSARRQLSHVDAMPRPGGQAGPDRATGAGEWEGGRRCSWSPTRRVAGRTKRAGLVSRLASPRLSRLPLRQRRRRERQRARPLTATPSPASRRLRETAAASFRPPKPGRVQRRLELLCVCMCVSVGGGAPNPKTALRRRAVATDRPPCRSAISFHQ